MPIENAASRLAEHLLECDFVEVRAHHDADGIAAASILCHALFRQGKEFRLRICPRITPEDIPTEGSVLLCDFGASLPDLPPEVMVVDHHVPRFEGEYHVNPHLAGIDGDRDLSASGAAYLVAQRMGDNRDLIGLALLGLIGDGQEFSGKNQEICGEGIANGFISPRRGIRLPGRDLNEQLQLAINPFLSGISGDEALARSIVVGSTFDGDTDLETLLSVVLIKMSPKATIDSMLAVYGNTYGLGREVIDEAHTLAALIDACGKAGAGDLGASLCLRSTSGLSEAWEIMQQYRLAVIAAVQGAERIEENVAIYRVNDGAVASDVADALAFDHLQNGPVFVFSQIGERYSVSARCPAGVDYDLEALMRTLAGECGGQGGGHRRRAGALIGRDQIGSFRQGLVEALSI